ncbi:MAG: hypothetical protein WDN45_17805 [Caulobacteraceae bacterium]
MLRGRGLASSICGLLLAAAPVDVTWAAGGYMDGLQALALLQTLNAELLSHDSATATLQAWCDGHGGKGQKIKADRVNGQDKPPSEAAKAALGLKPSQTARYRRVRLSCGDQVLSEADNWYLPERLTPEMNRVLDTSDTPFGVVARPLDFHRRTLSARLLYHPLSEGWETHPADDADPPPIPAEVLQHSAVLATPAGNPLAFVVETYTGGVLKMALPR